MGQHGFQQSARLRIEFGRGGIQFAEHNERVLGCGLFLRSRGDLDNALRDYLPSLGMDDLLFGGLVSRQQRLQLGEEPFALGTLRIEDVHEERLDLHMLVLDEGDPRKK
jgi:hypothetical protein